jgi:hypothetical protein
MMWDIFQIFEKLDWKVNDEIYSEFISRCFISNVYKYNYNIFCNGVRYLSTLKSTPSYLWSFIEYDFISKFKSLYKSFTLLKIIKGFAKSSYNAHSAYNLIQTFILNNQESQFNKIYYLDIAFILQDKYAVSEQLKSFINKTLPLCSSYQYNENIDFNTTIMLYSRLPERISQIKINKLLLELIEKKRFRDIYLFLSNCLEFNMLSRIEFNKINDSELIEVLSHLKCTFLQKLKLLGKLSIYVKKIEINMEQLLKITEHNCELDHLCSLVVITNENYSKDEEFQHKCRVLLFSLIENEMILDKFYDHLLLMTNFSKCMIDNKTKLKILNPKFMNLCTFDVKNKIQNFHSLKSIDEILILLTLHKFELYKSGLFLTSVPKLTLDLDGNNMLSKIRKIKHYMDLNLFELEEGFQVKFYSSFYD